MERRQERQGRRFCARVRMFLVHINLAAAGIPNLHRLIPNPQGQWLWRLTEAFLMLVKPSPRVWGYTNVEHGYAPSTNAVQIPVASVVRVRLDQPPLISLDNPHRCSLSSYYPAMAAEPRQGARGLAAPLLAIIVGRPCPNNTPQKSPKNPYETLLPPLCQRPAILLVAADATPPDSRPTASLASCRPSLCGRLLSV